MLRKQYLYKIYPPRPGFYSDQTLAEKRIMRKHIQYWQDLTDRESSVVFGPVYEPKGTFPMAVIEVRSRDEAENIAMKDPVILSGVFTYELFPMQAGVVHLGISYYAERNCLEIGIDG